MLKNKSNKKVPFSSGNVIISDITTNSYNFVFSNLKYAKHLYISTFNYYMENGYLEQVLKNINSIKDIRIIFNAYNDQTVEKIIGHSVITNPYVQLYYYPNNHSKIISDGQQMYIGSANYTGYSKENFEVGIQINDLAAISAIENEVFCHLYDYYLVISDPIQPIITLFTIVEEEYKKAMDWIEWFFEQAKISMSVRENDIDDMGYDFVDVFVNVINILLDRVVDIIVKSPSEFKDNGIGIINYIDSIRVKIKDSDSINLGLYTKQSFRSFYEDYLNCLTEYKNDFWVESLLEMTGSCISVERDILSIINTIKDMVIYLKIKWINEFKGEYKQHFTICKESCLKWLVNPNNAIQALESFLL